MTSPRQSKTSIPKLDFSKLPLLPGFGSTPVAKWDQNYLKKSMAFTAKQEHQGPQPNVVFHTYSAYSARPIVRNSKAGSADAKDDAEEEERIACATERTERSGLIATPPSKSMTPRRGNTPHERARWLRYDRETLRFYLYFQESVSESRLENFRVRKVTLLYYRSDDTIQVHEPKVENSGLSHGNFLKKVKINSMAPAVEDKEHLELCDLLIGKLIPLNGRVFRVVDVDEKTRHFFQEELGIEQGPAEEYPEDPVAKARREELEATNAALAANEAEGYSSVSVTKMSKPKDTLRDFLEYGHKALSFDAEWDDSASEHGDKRKFKVQYFLSDATIQINELYKANSGREPFPKFLSRNKVARANGCPGSLEASDFVCGQTVTINGRELLLLECDKFTSEFYQKQFGFEQQKVERVKEEKKLARMPQPPYNGFGSEEDSLGSFYNLVPRAPRKNFERQRLYEDQHFHIRVELVTDAPEEKGRQFDLSFNLADETLALFEPKKRNSGITGGKFLERGKYINATTNKLFVTEDLREPLQAAMDKRRGILATDSMSDCVTVLKRSFRVEAADRFTLNFFDIVPVTQAVPPTSTINDLLDLISAHCVSRDSASCSDMGSMRSIFRAADGKKVLSLNRADFKSALLDSTVGLGMNPESISDSSLNSISNRFYSGTNEVLYQDFCDLICGFAISNHGAMPKSQLAATLEPKVHMRPLFRNFDCTKTGKLPQSKFEELISRYSTNKPSLEELATLASKYRSEQDLVRVVDYNAFCDALYSCQLGGHPQENKELTTASEEYQPDVASIKAADVPDAVPAEESGDLI